MSQDSIITCRDCGREFTFTAEEHRQFTTRGFSAPARCPDCRKKRSPRRRKKLETKPVMEQKVQGRRPQQPKPTAPKPQAEQKSNEIFTAPCDVCGKGAVLRYRPTGLLPVYCRECFEEKLNDKTELSTRESVPRKREKVSREVYGPLAGTAGQVSESQGSLSEPTTTTTATIERPVRDADSSFARFGLDERLERAVSAAGYEIPTPVQLATIPIGLSGRDLIGTAQTGTGKTAAFVLPILQHILSNPVRQPCTRALVLTPTRELAEQISESFKELGKFTKIRTATVYGGVGMEPQERALRNGADVIVACPGRLLDHIGRGNTDFTGVEKLVLDEADRMLDMGFLPQIKQILPLLPRDRHSMLFSATFADELTKLARETLNDPQRVDVDICAPPKCIAHVLYPCPQHLKTSLLLSLLERTDTNSVLIFTKTKHRANRVAKQLIVAGYPAGVLHSNKSQNQRQSALDDFRAERSRILVATDIAARGIDVDTISHVINYDIPDTADTYIHRIGRTGRMEREGDAMTLVTKDDAAIIFEIERALGYRIERRKLDDFDYGAAAPSRDEFKRDPRPPRKPKPDTSQATGRARHSPASPEHHGPVVQPAPHSFRRRRPAEPSRHTDSRQSPGTA